MPEISDKFNKSEAIFKLEKKLDNKMCHEHHNAEALGIFFFQRISALFQCAFV